MKRLLAIAVAIASVTLLANQSEAQLHGFQFGVGLRQAHRNHGLAFRGFSEPREQPPYFAKFPPVYYNDIVPRNYGVSPYAVPAGIMPVEGIGKGKPARIVNEFYKKEEGENKAKNKDDAASEQSIKKAPWDNSARRIINPYANPTFADK